MISIIKSLESSSKCQAQDLVQALGPLSVISPQRLRDHRSPVQKKRQQLVFGHCWSNFSSSDERFKNDFEKTSKRVRKSRFWPPKTIPKSIQNRCPKKHAILDRFLFIFCCMLQEPTSKKRAPTQCFVSFSHNSVYHFLHALLVQKTYQKPFQNDVRTLPKSMLKMCCFLTSIFSGFGLDFGESWASNLEQSWLKMAPPLVR